MNENCFYSRFKLRELFAFLQVIFGIFTISFQSVSQDLETPYPTELPAAKNKILIEALINRIDNEAKDRMLNLIDMGEVLPVDITEEVDPIKITVHDKTLYFLANNCTDLQDIKNWNILFYPLTIDTSSDVDVQRPARNLKALLFKNGVILEDVSSSQCASFLELPNEAAYKVVGYKNVSQKRHWFFKKEFAEYVDYLHINRIEGRSKLAPKNGIVCKMATRLCYTNSRKPKYVASLTIDGLKSQKEKDFGHFYLETTRTAKEINAQFPKFALKELKAPQSNIAEFIADNLEHTIAVSIRDNAIGRLKEMDLFELERLGVDLSELSIRGAHVSMIRPEAPPINITNNEKPVLLLSEDHNVPYLGTVMSAGFSMGDNSVVSLKGENVSINKRGINIVVVDSKGRLVTSRNFDTHIAANRSQGFYKVNMKE